MPPLIKRPRVWMQSVARRTLLGEESMNPSIAARSLLGAARIRIAERIIRKRFGRKRRSPGNPLPAFAGSIVGALPGVGRKFDPKKHAQRIARIDQWAGKAAAGQAVDYHMQVLEDIAEGRPTALVATYDEIRAYAAAKLAPLVEAQAKRAEQVLEQKEAAREAAAARSARESRFLEAGTSIGTALASGFGRRGSLRRPRRRRRRSYY